MTSSQRERKNALQRDWRATNLEKAREIGRRSYHKHRDKNLQRAALHRAANRDEVNARKRDRYRALSPEERWDLKLRKTYGICAEDFHDLLASQDGVCAICRQPERAGRDGRLVRLSVDHCHTTGRVRGLLCRACNTRVGIYEGRHVDDIRRYPQRTKES